MLANLAIERIAVAPDTPIERLIEFREKHRDELAQFRTKVEQLASSIEADLSAEALRQRVSELYTDEVVPAIGNVKAALNGRRIKWLGDGLLKVGFLSAGSSTMLVVAGLAVPTALLAGAGISLIATGVMYNVD
jgi:predicted phage tail protein